eukprot:2912122-Amphidinium_carterae.1
MVSTNGLNRFSLIQKRRVKVFKRNGTGEELCSYTSTRYLPLMSLTSPGQKRTQSAHSHVQTGIRINTCNGQASLGAQSRPRPPA